MVSRAAVTNPFEQTIVKDPWCDPVDVTAINAHVSRTILAELEHVRTTGDSRGVVVVGQAGTGKTHLIARLRRTLAETRAGHLAQIPPLVGEPAGFARHVLHHLVASLTRSPHPALRELFHAFMIRGVLGTHDRPVHVNRARLLELTDQARALVHGVAPAADGDVLTVLAATVRGLEPLAHRWLCGLELGADELTQLGVARTIASEDEALRAIEAISAIASLITPQRVIVFAFDQVDAYVDAMRRQRFGEVAAELVHRANHLVLTMCLIATWQDIERDLKTPLVQRLSRGGLPPLEMRALSADEIKLVIEQRLQVAFGAEPRPSPWHPFSQSDLAAFTALAPGRVPARAVLNEARLRFEQWQQDTADAAAELPLLAQVRQSLEQSGLALEASQDPFDLVVGGGAQRVGLAVFETLDGHAWRRLARIEERGEATIDHALVVHAQGLRPGANAVKTRELLKRLQRGERSQVVEAGDDLAELIGIVREHVAPGAASAKLDQEIADVLTTRRSMSITKLRAALPGSISEAAALAAVRRLAERGTVTCREYHDEVEVRLNRAT